MLHILMIKGFILVEEPVSVETLGAIDEQLRLVETMV